MIQQGLKRQWCSDRRRPVGGDTEPLIFPSNKRARRKILKINVLARVHAVRVIVKMAGCCIFSVFSAPDHKVRVHRKGWGYCRSRGDISSLHPVIVTIS